MLGLRVFSVLGEDYFADCVDAVLLSTSLMCLFVPRCLLITGLLSCFFFFFMVFANFVFHYHYWLAK